MRGRGRQIELRGAPGATAEAMRRVAKTMADHISAFGGRPMLRIDNHKIVGGLGEPLFVTATLTDNAVVNTDLRTQALWDARVQQHYGSSASSLVRGVLRLEAVSLCLNGGTAQAETSALKASLDNAAYVEVQVGAVTRKIPLRGHIYEPFRQFQFAQAAAAAEQRVLMGPESPFILNSPMQIDLEADTFAFKIDSAINWAGGDVGAVLKIYGFIAPRGTFGADGVNSVNIANMEFIEDQNNLASAAGPADYAPLNAGWLARFRNFVSGNA